MATAQGYLPPEMRAVEGPNFENKKCCGSCEVVVWNNFRRFEGQEKLWQERIVWVGASGYYYESC